MMLASDQDNGFVRLAFILTLGLLLIASVYIMYRVPRLTEENRQLRRQMQYALHAHSGHRHPEPAPEEPEPANVTSSTAAPSPRPETFRLSLDAVDSLRKQLQGQPARSVQIDHVMGNYNAFALAEQMADVFKQSGWEVTRGICMCSPPPKHLSVVLQDQPGDETRATFESMFEALHLPELIEVDPELTKEAALITVGVREPR